MTRSLENNPGILYFSSQLKFPKEDVSSAHGILEIIFKKMGFLKYKPGNLNCSCHLNFPNEDVF